MQIFAPALVYLNIKLEFRFAGKLFMGLGPLSIMISAEIVLHCYGTHHYGHLNFYVKAQMYFVRSYDS